MNKIRKRNIKTLKEILSGALRELEAILDQEQDYYDNMPENLQCGSRADTSQEAIDDLTSAIDSLNDVVDHLSNI